MNAHELLEQLMDQLDSQWNAGTATQTDLQQLIKHIPTTMPESMDIAIELCAADVEWHWRKQMLRQIQPGIQSDSYRKLLAAWWDETTCLKRMHLAEWRARSSVGDRPDIDSFGMLWINDLSWMDQLNDELEILGYMSGRIDHTGIKMLTLRLPPKFEVGRQNREEPTAPCWLAQQRRLVIADISNTEVSRNQLSIRRTRLTEIELTNSSKKVPVSLERHDLCPGESQRQSIPCTVQMGNTRLKIGVHFN